MSARGSGSGSGGSIVNDDNVDALALAWALSVASGPVAPGNDSALEEALVEYFANNPLYCVGMVTGIDNDAADGITRGTSLDGAQARASLGVSAAVAYIRKFDTTTSGLRPDEVLANLGKVKNGVIRDLAPIFEFLRAETVTARDEVSPEFLVSPEVELPQARGARDEQTRRAGDELADALARRGIPVLALPDETFDVSHRFIELGEGHRASYVVRPARREDKDHPAQRNVIAVDASRPNTRNELADMLVAMGAVRTHKLWDLYEPPDEPPDDAIVRRSGPSLAADYTVPGVGYLKIHVLESEDFCTVRAARPELRALTAGLTESRFGKRASALTDSVVAPHEPADRSLTPAVVHVKKTRNANRGESSRNGELARTLWDNGVRAYDPAVTTQEQLQQLLARTDKGAQLRLRLGETPIAVRVSGRRDFEGAKRSAEIAKTQRAQQDAHVVTGVDTASGRPAVAQGGQIRSGPGDEDRGPGRIPMASRGGHRASSAESSRPHVVHRAARPAPGAPTTRSNEPRTPSSGR